MNIEEPKFSVIVPVHDVPTDTLKRCLESIEDQDYANLEVIIVPNADKKAEEDVKSFCKGKDWKVIPTDTKGACHARNLGFRNSTGEIVAFVNSDYVLNTGIITYWVDQLNKHPECGFVYGAYEYASSNRDVYWSRPFDPFLLEVANYIDCGFPLRREFVVEWGEDIKSLQDWDFWIRVVRKGVKGHYLGREISFIAEYPRPKGLSMDSSENWLERVRTVREKNGIPIRDICVTSLGAPNHGVEIAKLLDADYRDDTLHKPHNYKALYLIGWYMKSDGGRNGHPQILQLFEKSTRIVHFIGADIYWLKSFPWSQLKFISAALNDSVDHILCENETARKELEELGIKATIVPIPPYTNLEIKPLPKDFSVALYLTDRSDFDKYMIRQTLSIVKAMPDIQFEGYGDAQLTGFEAHNFKMRGNLSKPEWEKFVYSQSAYLRLVKHDTAPMASAEFMIAGRNVISNIPDECTDYISTRGIQAVDEWDHFGPGFNPDRWPDIKAQIVRKIREVKKNQIENDSVFQAERLATSIATKHRFSREKYIGTIKQLKGEKCQKSAS